MTIRCMLPVLMVLGLAGTAWGRDEVLEQIRIERAQAELRHAEAELAWRLTTLRWASAMPAEGEGAPAQRSVTGRENAALEVAKAELEVTLKGIDLDLTLHDPATPLFQGHGLSSPLVDGRDLATERREAQLAHHLRRREILSQRRDRQRALAERGAVPHHEMERVEEWLLMERLSIEALQLQLEHRARHLAGTLPFDARLQRERLVIDRDRQLAERRLERARQRVSDLDPLVQRRLTSTADFDHARHEVRRQEQALELNELSRRSWERRHQHAADEEQTRRAAEEERRR